MFCVHTFDPFYCSDLTDTHSFILASEVIYCRSWSCLFFTLYMFQEPVSIVTGSAVTPALKGHFWPLLRVWVNAWYRNHTLQAFSSATDQNLQTPHYIKTCSGYFCNDIKGSVKVLFSVLLHLAGKGNYYIKFTVLFILIRMTSDIEVLGTVCSAKTGQMCKCDTAMKTV